MSPSLGVLGLWLSDTLNGRDPYLVWMLWWLGDAGGAALVAPLVWAWLCGGPPWRTLASRGESYVLLALVVVTGVLGSERGIPPWLAMFLDFLAYPLVLLAGLRLGSRGAVSLAALAATLAILGAARGAGPFAEHQSHQALLLVWAYGVTLAACATILAAAVAERDRAEAERDRRAREARALRDQMRRADRLESLGVLAGGVAHDFNNLLVPILLNAELLERRASDPDQQDKLQQVRHAAERAAELCRRLLDHSGKSERRAQPVDVSELAADVLGVVRSSIGAKISVVPRLATRTMVHADPTQLRQVVQNLLLNAAEAIGDAAGTIVIETRTTQVDAELSNRAFLPTTASGEHVALEVVDSGCGMDAATAEHVFEPFFTTKDHGRGLGMATVVGVVRAHGGTLGIDSALGKGTRVTVLLPAAEPEAQLDAERRPALETPTPDPLSILVADDIDAVRRVVATFLARDGHRVLEASDGARACEIFEQNRGEIDLVILDVDMPEKSGLEALADMRAQRPELPAVLMTGHDAAALEGFDAELLAKPFDPEGLRAAVSEALRRSTIAASA